MIVEELITAIRQSFGGSIAVYTMGNCYQFYEILKVAFPYAEAYYDGNHVWTKIGDDYYDIRGKANLPKNRKLTLVEGDLIRSLSVNKCDDAKRLEIKEDFINYCKSKKRNG